MRSHLFGSYAVANVNKGGPIPIWMMVTFEPLVESTEPQSLTSHLHALSYAGLLHTPGMKFLKRFHHISSVAWFTQSFVEPVNAMTQN